MDWDYTLSKDEHADYAWGGQWLTSKEIQDAVHKSPLYITDHDMSGFTKYHRTWTNTSEELDNVQSFHQTSASRYGLATECAFEDYVKENTSFAIKSAGRFNDHRYRTDYFLGIDSLEIPLDVKALKSVRHNTHQNKYFWIELHRNGWLFSPDSRSTLLAIECFPMHPGKDAPEGKSEKYKFVLVDKLALKDFCKERFKEALTLPPVMNAPQALLRAYRRKGEKSEWLGFVEFKDLLEHCALCLI